jgi:hypothetical protein
VIEPAPGPVVDHTCQTGQCVRMAKTVGRSDGPDDAALLALFGAIASHDCLEIARRLDLSLGLASRPIRIGASRQDADTYFLAPIRYHVYGGDTALHIASAAYQRELAESLVAKGADVRARNRRGAEPLHYAADGGPDADHWDPVAQCAVIAYLIAAGADPNALERVAWLHCIEPFGLVARRRSAPLSRTVRIRI